MKGVVFNLLEAFVCENWGEDAYEDILALCPLKTKEPFVGPGTYPDSDLMTIAQQAAAALQTPLPGALRAFGHFCFPRLVEKCPSLVAQYKTPRELLLSVHNVIHVEVRKLYPAAVTPDFSFEEVGAPGEPAQLDQLIMHYRSKRKLCAFLEGLLQGLSDHFGEKIEFTHDACMHRGAEACRLHLTFAGVAEKVA